MPWSRPFDEPIIPPKGKPLVTLKDAADFIMALPRSKQHSAEWQAAGELVIGMAAEDRGPMMQCAGRDDVSSARCEASRRSRHHLAADAVLHCTPLRSQAGSPTHPTTATAGCSLCGLIATIWYAAKMHKSAVVEPAADRWSPQNVALWHPRCSTRVRSKADVPGSNRRVLAYGAQSQTPNSRISPKVIFCGVVVMAQ